MKKAFYIIIIAALVLATACGNKKEEQPEGKSTKSLQLKDDHTVYGLACEGCSDSVIVLLPQDCSDPVTYDIIDASRLKKVIGHPKIGDWIGLVLNKDDKTVADMVIDLDQLKGTWCYVVMPKMRNYEDLPKRVQDRMMRDMPDSIKDTYLIPREYGFTLGRQFKATPVGMMMQNNSLVDESPVVYEAQSLYTGWHILNGKLVLTRIDGNVNGKMEDAPTANDTVDIIFLDDNNLRLRFKDYEREYYRLSDASEANKEARAKAEQLARDAQKQITGETTTAEDVAPKEE